MNEEARLANPPLLTRAHTFSGTVAARNGQHGSFAIASSLGYQRFCSNYLATAKEGFTRDILFTNEESPDYVYRQEESWPPVAGSPAEQEVGLVVALDVRTGKQRPIYGMGRHNHENAVAVPGYDGPVVMSGDDTFTSGPLTGVFPAGAVPSQSQTTMRNQRWSASGSVMDGRRAPPQVRRRGHAPGARRSRLAS